MITRLIDKWLNAGVLEADILSITVQTRDAEEPDAGNPLVRICGGAGEVTPRLYPDD